MHNAVINGPFEGATLRGKVDFRAQVMDVGGTYVGGTGIMQVIASIPLLGPILTGPRGEGVFGITFAIKGSMANPQVVVNPLALLTPGIFREIFQMTDEDPRVVPRERPTPKRDGARSSSAPASGPPGGTLVAPDTVDPLRRRLRNVVEEMAIASGVPVPEIYVLEAESGINAFAAGFAPGDAAVAVTRGTLESLDRDELQGVIAHEFSHILNGDMRLNIRLMGVLFGIMVLGLIGRTVLRSGSRVGRMSSRRSRGQPVVLLIGLGLTIIGWIVFGLVVGVIAKLLMPGHDPGGVIVTALIGIAGANVAMILFGWLQESANPPGRSTVTMKPFWFGCIAGVAPWVAIGYNVVAAEEVPGFVIGIFVSLFLFFNSFALNQWLQYRQAGPWRSYAFGEKGYLVLSLVAKSALAWQIFGGSLAS